MLIQSNIVRGKTSRITKNILVSNLHFILSFSVISHQSQRRILFTPYHCSEQNERLILFPHIMYLFYQTMNGNALSLKNVRLKNFIKTWYVLKDLKQCNNYAMYLIQFKASVWLNHFVIIRLPLLIESRAIRLVHTWQLRQGLKIFWILNRKV